MSADVQRVLGSGHYSAHWVARSNLVSLTATGILPCQNQFAQLEMRPERVVPPMWNLVFYVEDLCERALKPFTDTVVMVNTSGAAAILVHDASGVHEIEIRQAFEPEIDEMDDYIVYARLPVPENGHTACFIAPAETLVSAVHYCAFGPAPKEACEQFVADQSVEEAALAVNHITRPWPLVS